MRTDPIGQRYELMAGHLNEHQRRLWAGAEAQVLGWGGISRVSRATGLSRGVVAAGRRALRQPNRWMLGDRVRRPGGGRTRLTVRDPMLKTDLERLIEPPRGANRNRRCAGPARARANGRRRYAIGAIR